LLIKYLFGIITSDVIAIAKFGDFSGRYNDVVQIVIICNNRCGSYYL